MAIAFAALKLVKSKWVWMGLAVIVAGGWMYKQHRDIVEMELDNQALTAKNNQITIQVMEADAARAKLIEDINRMNEINQTLETQKQVAEHRLSENRKRLTTVLKKLPTLKTPEEVKAVGEEVQSMIVESYGCLEAATGKEGVSCVQ